MSITEHIQDVANNIAAQRVELSEIQDQRKQAGLMTGIWALIYGAVLIVGRAEAPFIVTGLAFLVFNLSRFIRFEKAFRLTSVLLSDNEHYKEIIVDEAYSGKEFGPQD